MKMTLERRIILFSFLILFLTLSASAGLDIMAVKTDYVNALHLRTQSLGRAVKGNLEKVLNLGLDLKDMAGISDKCRETIEGNPDIAYCVITDPHGEPLHANDPRFLAFPRTAVQSLDVYRSQVAIRIAGLDENFYDTSLPIIVPDGRPVAFVHVGFQESVVTDKVWGMIYRTISLLILSLVSAFSLVVFFVKKYIMRPISTLLTGVKQISEGAFDTQIGDVQVFEFNELARNVNIMSQFLQNRDVEIKKNYEDMQHTLMELHDSYSRLETLSAELERSEELYKSLMEDSSDAIVVLGPDDSVRMVNKMGEHFFGYTAKELVGLPLTKMLLLLNISNIPKFQRIFRDAAAGAAVAEEMQLVKKGGGVMVALLHASRIRSGSENLVQAIFRDVTREREIIANLEKSSADLARLNRMKDSFLGLASHELKTPLTIIMGYSELICTDMADRVDKTVLEMIVNIANAASRLDNIIKDMVDVSMIDEKRLQLKMDDVQLNRLIEAAVKELRFFFSMRKQEVVLALDESIPTIRGDALRLMQLLSNILGNAIKFTPDGGKITVTSSAKYLLRGLPGGQNGAGKEHHLFLEIAVTDTGIGIDREDQLRIFEKFYEVGNIQEHSSGKVAFKAKGAGLGLSIAKGIVDMHGGEIWVESTGYSPERMPGSTFHILLPLNPNLGESTVDYTKLLG